MGSRIRGLRSSLPAFVPDNENAVIYFLYNLATSLSNGILFGGLTASYLYLETGNSPSKVGYAEGIFGVCMLLPGLIGGYFSDNGRRDRIIRWGGIGTIVGSVAQMLVLVAGDIGSDTVFRRSLEHHVPGIGSVKFTAMCACIILLQSGESIGDASGKALLADSISTGSRLEFFLKQATYTFAALSVGPVIAVICFLVLGNTWTLKNLSIVLLLGLAIRIPCGLLCFQFSDDFALAKESADVRQVQIHNAMSTNSAEPADAQERELRRLSARSKHYGKVPYVLYSASVIAMIGSGMTVKFFPIFFQTAATDGGLELSPVVVVLICLGRRLACMLGSRTLLKFSRIVGRAQVELLAWYVGIAGATGIVVMGYTGHYTTRLPDRLGILVLYLLRVGTLQATGPIRSSIMMDFVPKNKRARWASLQQINQVGWSGSAALGGLLIETHSYRFVFLITAVVHFASTLPKLSLLCIIPRHEVSMISKQPAPAEPQQIAGPAEDSDEDNERTALVINA